MQFRCVVIWVSDLILNLFTDFDAILFEGKHGKKTKLGKVENLMSSNIRIIKVLKCL